MSRIRSSHSSLSLHSAHSDNASPGPGQSQGTIGHCLQSLPMFNDLNQNFCLDHDVNLDLGNYHQTSYSR